MPEQHAGTARARRKNTTAAHSAKRVRAAGLVLLGELRRVGEQRLRLVVDPARRLLREHQPVHVLQDRADALVVGGEALLELDQRGARLLVLDTGETQRLAALEQPVQDVAERAGVLAEQERDLGIDLLAGRERVRVLGDPLRQHRELVRVLDLAQAAAALADLLRRLLRELEDRVVALVDVVETLGERRQALLVVDDAAGVDVDAVPPGADVREELRRRSRRTACRARRP